MTAELNEERTEITINRVGKDSYEAINELNDAEIYLGADGEISMEDVNTNNPQTLEFAILCLSAVLENGKLPNRIAPMIHLTDRVGEILVFAQRYAAELGDSKIGMEHIMLGMLRDKSNLGTSALHKLGVKNENLISTIEILLGKDVPSLHPPKPRPYTELEFMTEVANRSVDGVWPCVRVKQEPGLRQIIRIVSKGLMYESSIPMTMPLAEACQHLEWANGDPMGVLGVFKPYKQRTDSNDG